MKHGRLAHKCSLDSFQNKLLFGASYVLMWKSGENLVYKQKSSFENIHTTISGSKNTKSYKDMLTGCLNGTSTWWTL